MKSTIKAIFVLIVLWLATASTTGRAQSDDKTHDAKDDKTHPSKENNKTVELKITKTGAGEATIISSPVGIQCGDSCRANFKPKTSVTLTAVVAAGSTFKSWSGDCKGTATSCTVTMKEAQNVTAKTARLPITLNIAKTGSGTGTVTSVPAGIDCGAVCSATYPQKNIAHHADSKEDKEKDNKKEHDNKHDDKGDHDNKDDDDASRKPAALVTLTAIPATGSVFSGWSGACAGAAVTCTVTMNQIQNVTASFTSLQLALSIAKTGTGTGAITSTPAGIDCGAACSGSYAWSTPVILTAVPENGSMFSGWSGACTGITPTCTVTMDQAQNVTAGFTPMQMTLNAVMTGTGTGAIISLQSGIDCGTSCSGSYDWNTPVTLVEIPATGSAFTGWSGACTGTADTCTVTMDQIQNVTASFAPIQITLTAAKTGAGTGTITSSPGGIDCGATCSASFATNSQITLTAGPATGSTFGGWFGACTGTATTCTVTLGQSRSVNASFTAPAVTTYQYDPNGNLTQITDPLGRVRQVQFDALNRPIRQLEPHPTQIGSTLGQIDTAYDNLGQLISVTDPRNLTTHYSMDSLGNLQQQTSPDTGVTDASHDEAGNLKTRVDARGKTANYSYDSLNRISQIVYDDQTVNYTWDTCANGIGRLCSVSNNNSSITTMAASPVKLKAKTKEQPR